MTNLNDRDIGYNFPHWHYYLNLEKELTECFRYVEPTQSQFQIDSEEFARIILLASSEFENALRELCREKTSSSEGNLQALFKLVREIYPNLVSMEFNVPRYSIALQPLADWVEASDGNPDWWKSGYNDIKHDRLGRPSSANLIRAFNSFAALQLILLHLYEAKYTDPVLPIVLAPNLIVPTREMSESYWGTGIITWEWKLPDDPEDQTE